MSAAERSVAARSNGGRDLGGPREILSALLQRLLHPRPLVLETRRPVEVPVLTETKRRWARGDRGGAVRYGYAAVLTDLERGFSVSFPPDWTHEDILERGVTAEMDSIPEFLERLVAIYERVRYAGSVPRDLPSPEPLLQSIYAHPRMWGLYIAEVPATPSDAASSAGEPEGPTDRATPPRGP